MQDGLYAVTFQTALGAGSGVLYKAGDHTVGGDGGFAWQGPVSVSGDHAQGTLNVVKHNNAYDSVFGPLDNFALNYEGSVGPDGGTIKATSPQAPTMTLQVVLKRLAS